MTLFLIGVGLGIVGFVVTLAVLFWDWTLDDRRSEK